MKIDQQKIENLITPIVEGMGYIVWHIDIHKIQRKILLRIYLDVPLGDMRKSVSIDDCSLISNQIGALFDVEEPILGSYILEVSSPGLNRSLFRLEHYQQYIGRMVHVVLQQPLNGRRDFTGKIQQAIDGTLKIEVNGQIVDIDIANINKAKLTLDL